MKYINKKPIFVTWQITLIFNIQSTYNQIVKFIKRRKEKLLKGRKRKKGKKIGSWEPIEVKVLPEHFRHFLLSYKKN